MENFIRIILQQVAIDIIPMSNSTVINVKLLKTALQLILSCFSHKQKMIWKRQIDNVQTYLLAKGQNI